MFSNQYIYRWIFLFPPTDESLPVERDSPVPNVGREVGSTDLAHPRDGVLTARAPRTFIVLKAVGKFDIHSCR